METTSVFKLGPFNTKETSDPYSPITPLKPLLVVHPSETGDYPVVIFFHGFWLHNTNYREIFIHIASHGYIIVAPQMYNCFPKCTATQGIKDAQAITEWLTTGLSYYLPSNNNVRADFTKIVVAGHSRGGKVAFGAALRRGTTTPSYSAIIGLDPVDGLSSRCPIPPPILTENVHSFGQGVPVLVIGSGIPHQCMSPDGVNHRNFFEECSHPAYHFVVKICRHLDFLDQNVDRWALLIESIAALICEPCQDGETRRKIRSFVGGIMVAFLNGCVKDDYADLEGVLADPSVAPVEIEPPEVYLAEKARLVSLSV